jgi:nucleotide-binding universal stress UspA family protein
VLTWAAQLAADCQAQLAIAHSLASLDPGFPYDSSPQFRLELETLAGKEMQKLQAATKTEAAQVHILGGGPAQAIRALAESSGADLLVIGRGPKDTAGGRLPANAYAILRESPCPVISV